MSSVIDPLVIPIDSTPVNTAKVALDELTKSGQDAEGQANRTGAAVSASISTSIKSAEAWKSQHQEITATSDELQKILARYDPLGAKLRQLQSDFANLDKAIQQNAIGSTSDMALDKSMQALNVEIAKTKGLMDQAGVGLNAGADAATNLGLGNRMATRELMMLGREVMTGDFSRMPLTFSSLVMHSNLFAAAMTLTGASVAAAAVTIGVLVYAAISAEKEITAMNTAIASTNSFAGMTRDGIVQMAETISTSGTITIGTAKDIVTQIVASGRYTSESVGVMAGAVENYAAVTKQSTEKSAESLIKMFEDPAKASENLNQQFHYLSASQLQYIQQVQDGGDKQAAATVAIRALNDFLAQQDRQLGITGTWWKNLTQNVSGYLDTIKRLAGGGTLEQQMQTLQETIAKVKSAGATDDTTSVINMKAQLAVLMDQYVASQKINAAKVDKNALDQKELEALAIANKYGTDKIASLQVERQKIIDNGQEAVNGGRALAAIDQQIAALQLAGGEQGKALSDAAIANELALAEQKNKNTIDDIDAQVKLGTMSAVMAAQQKSDAALALNNAHILDVEQTLAYGNLTALQRIAKQNDLDRLVAQSGIVVKQGEEAVKVAQLKTDTDELLVKFKAWEEFTKGITAEQNKAGLETQAYNAYVDEAVAKEDEKLNLLGQSKQYQEVYNALVKLEVEYKKDGKSVGDDQYRLDQQRVTAAAMLTGAAEDQLAAQKKLAEADKKFVDELDRDAKQGFDKMFQKLDGGWTAMMQSFAMSFKRIVADALYLAFAKPFFLQIIASVAGMVGATGVASAANNALTAAGAVGSGVNAASGASTFSSLFSSFYSGASQMITGGVQSIGAALGSQYIADIGSGMAAASFAEASTMGVAGQIGYAIPYIGWVLAAYSVWKAFFSNHGPSAVSTADAGVAYTAAPVGATPTATGTDWTTFGAGGGAAMTDSLAKAYASAMAGLGQLVTNASYFYFGSNQLTDGTNPNFRMSSSVGGKTYDTGPAETPLTDAAVQLAASRAVLNALQGSDLPAYLQHAFDSLLPASATQAQIDAAMAFAQSLKTIHDNLTETRPAFQVLTDASTALQTSLGTSAATFKQDFLSAIDAGITPAALANWQQLATLLDTISAAVAATVSQRQALITHFQTPQQNQADAWSSIQTTFTADKVPASVTDGASLIAFVKGLDATDPAMQKVIADLTALVPAFDLLHAKDLAIAAEKQTLQDRLDAATMTSAQLLEKQRNALDDSNKALFDQAVAAEKLAAAAVVTSGLQANQATANIALLRAYGEQDKANAAERAIAIAGMTTEQVAIYDTTQQTIAYTAWLVKMAATTAGLMTTQGSLEIQLMQAQGNAAGALAAQRAIDIKDMNSAQIALYDYNQKIKDQIAITVAFVATTATRLSWEEKLKNQLELNSGMTQQQIDREKELAGTHDWLTRQLMLETFAAEDVAAATAAAAAAAVTATSGLSALIAKGLLGQISASDLGKQAADIIINGIYNAMANTAAQAVTDIINKYMMEPIMKAILDGSISSATISLVLQQANIDLMVKSATIAVEAFAAIFNDPAFQKAMEDLKVSLSGLFGTIGTGNYQSPGATETGTGTGTTSINTTAAASTAYADALKALLAETAQFVSDLSHIGESTFDAALRKINEDAVKRLAALNAITPGFDFFGTSVDNTAAVEAWRLAQVALLDAQTKAAKAVADIAVTAGLMTTRGNLEISLMQAQGNAAGALAAQRTLDTAGMTTAQIALYDYNQTLKDQITEIKITAGLMTTQGNLEIQLMTAQGNTAGALAAQRLIDIAGMTAAQIAMYDYNQTLKDQITLIGLQKAAATTELGLNKQLYDLSHSAADQLANNRTLQMALLTAQEVAAHLVPGTLTDIQKQIDKQLDMATAAKAATDAMTKLVGQMDAVAAFKDSLTASIQTIRQDATGYNMAGYLAGQVATTQGKLALDVGQSPGNPGATVEQRLKDAAAVQAAIMAQYNYEKTALAAKATAEQAAYNAGIAAQNKAIDAANTLSAAFKGIGDYAQSLLTGAESPLSGSALSRQLATQYRSTIAGAQGNDLTAAGNVKGVTDAFLANAKTTSVTALDYARAFAHVQTDLATLSAKAMPTIAQVTADGFQISAALQTEMNASEQKAIDALKHLSDLTDVWQRELQDKLIEQALIFTHLGLTSEQIAANTLGLDVRIGAVIAAALGAQYEVKTILPPAYLGPPDVARTPPIYLGPPAPGTPSADNAALASSVDSLKTEVAGLRASTDKTAANTGAFESFLRRLSPDGNSLTVTVAP